MPKYHQGDIFEIFNDDDFELAIVFGHTSFNFMGALWQKFKGDIPAWNEITDPFKSFRNTPQEYKVGKWFWFVSDREKEEKVGMSDSDIETKLKEIFFWAKDNNISRIITNGAGGIYSEDKYQNDNRRAVLLKNLIEKYEDELKLDVTLISLNDVFVRNFVKPD